ncbi:hypothetical protein HPB52_012676 [Rhipicephalus sanguineus]|uniref:Uncharacterized protein n=1 Tax=Rhipicephalus sanguineus TaxID=34632 RepID=A0A9D4PDG0_RHISA|nr:hypothetical protein HPB52_012676 [Rhipicephalus sanguineus]
MDICLQKAKDPSQPDDRAAKYERKAQKLQDYYRLCCCRLQENDGPQAEQIQSTASPAESVTVTYEVDVDTVFQDSSSENSRMGQVLAPSANLMPDNELGLTSSCSYGSSFENIPGDHIVVETDVDMVTASGSRPRQDSSLSDD